MTVPERTRRHGRVGPAPPPPDEDRPKPPPAWKLFADARVLNYLFVGLAGLAMTFVVMFLRGSDVGGLCLIIVGACGLVLRWPWAPPAVLAILTWFLVSPLGIPQLYDDPSELANGSFRVADVMLVAAVMVYLASHYRLYGLTTQAMPGEPRPLKADEGPVRRPATLVGPGEITRFLWLTAGVIVAGQFVWLLAVSVEVDVLAAFPFRLVGKRQFAESPTGDVPSGAARFLALAGMLFFGTLVARLVFGYWRLRVMTAGEAGMILQDAGWDETRGERRRTEAWRAWGKKRAEERAKQKAGAEQRAGRGEQP